MKKQNCIIPILTVFVASFCIMVVEITASRIVARYLGASLYTWTSVIGVVLAGIALGNYIGGRLADCFKPFKLLPVLFILASISCGVVPLLNSVVGEANIFWILPLLVRTALHVFSVFFIPSVFLGAVAPLVTKAAIDGHHETGRTLGTMYAWSAVGSIAGTFIAGFVLIPNMGILSIIFSVAGVLAAMGISYVIFMNIPKSRLSFICAIFFIGLLIVGISSLPIAQTLYSKLGFEEATKSNVVYQINSQYSHIKVVQPQRTPHLRKLVLDRLLHSVVDINDPTNLDSVHQYSYLKLYGGLTRFISKKEDGLHALVIGGGGYVFPRYLEQTYPGSTVEVTEIDPAVTKTAYEALGLSKDTTLQIYHKDGRAYVEELAWRKQQGQSVDEYDFIYGDAVNDLSVPHQLTTYEFNEKVKGLLADDGTYLLTAIDNLQSGKFLGALVNTLERSFSFVDVFATEVIIDEDSARNTFVVMAAKQKIDLQKLSLDNFSGMQLTDAQIKMVKDNAKQIVLTDDYAPIDALLGPAYAQREREITAVKIAVLADRFAKENKLQEAVEYYRKALDIDWEFANAHNNLGSVYARQGNLQLAFEHYQHAIRIAPRFAGAHTNLAMLATKAGRLKETMEHYRAALEIDPFSVEAHYNLGTFLYANKKYEAAMDHYNHVIQFDSDFAEAYQGIANALIGLDKKEEAIDYYKVALKIQPNSAKLNNNIGALLVEQEKFEEAIEYYQEALRIDPNYERAKVNLEVVYSKQESEIETGEVN